MIRQQLNQQSQQQQLQQVGQDRWRSLPYSQQSSRRKRGKNFTFNENGFYQDIRATSSYNSRNIQRYGQSLQQRSLSIQSDQYAIQHDFPIFLSSESQRGRTFQKAQQSQDINPNILYKANQYGKIMGVTVNPRLETKAPAPNAYNVQYNIGQDKQKVKLKSRSFSSYDNGNPSSNQYNIQDKLQQNGRFGSISLGFGKKYDFVKVRNRNPGPGSYEISGFADQIKNKYQNLNKMRLKNIQVKI
ncbi:hypothetical protein PPERSA_12770 [Pseudocohnilembus persalinus]|uniref:Uncharacterized protein n=1 Tax=Pseudocohnilembus persalinus TaxID=266149 RepID=A0A0V0QUG7_PSEPJ|nr:hypothetical protein PPERSA_12770 [Pseudocohnilembus persalinus]|eukprot:KRX05592.1 hypothetical protein PPERSA_12770 [Pseudocohnilembus persalinus]